MTRQAQRIAAEGSIWDHMYVEAPESVERRFSQEEGVGEGVEGK